MTTPILAPSKAKAWWALITALLAVAAPYILQIAADLPQPWPIVVGGIIAALGSVKVYMTPYLPSGTVIAPASSSAPDYPPAAPTGPSPWPRS